MFSHRANVGNGWQADSAALSPPYVLRLRTFSVLAAAAALSSCVPTYVWGSEEAVETKLLSARALLRCEERQLSEGPHLVAIGQTHSSSGGTLSVTM